MAAEGSYNPATKVLTVTGNGLPTPVTNGTFPNANNANTISPYTFNHAFTYRGGENTSNSGSFSVGIVGIAANGVAIFNPCLLYTSPSPRDSGQSRMPSSA